jgi:hypothetical protein
MLFKIENVFLPIVTCLTNEGESMMNLIGKCEGGITLIDAA